MDPNQKRELESLIHLLEIDMTHRMVAQVCARVISHIKNFTLIVCKENVVSLDRRNVEWRKFKRSNIKETVREKQWKKFGRYVVHRLKILLRI